MKNYLIILCLFLTSCVHAYKVTYTETMPMYGYCPCNRAHNNTIYRSNPYMNPYIPHYRNYSTFNTNYKPSFWNYSQRPVYKKFKKIGFIKKDNGSITGYSVPVQSDDIYKQMGISPYDPKSKQKYNSINCSQDLFSTPSGDEMYYKNGEYYKDLKGTSGKTGVTIIYD